MISHLEILVYLFLVSKPDLVVGAILMLRVLGTNSLAEPILLQGWFEFKVFILLEPSMHYNLLVPEDRIVGFISFQSILLLCEI